MNILVIAPHPDDEVLGCGGTIAKYAARGDTVSVCYVTTAYPPDWSEDYLVKKEIEIKRSNVILGISRRFDLNYPTVKLDTVPQKDLNASLQNAIQKVRPDCIFIPHRGDLNMDHRIVHDASLVALRPINHRSSRILSYETLSETEWGQGIEPFTPNVYVDISENINQKCSAMSAYQSEIRQAPHPRSVDIIMANAKKRGSEICVPFAEAFVLIRECDIE
jgi:LmbE family N-acetylglucosaminyl deacetylase